MDNVEKIAKIIRSCIYKPGVAEWEDITSREQKPWLETAQAILSDPNIIEIDPDAELPQNPYMEAERGIDRQGYIQRIVYNNAQQDMLKAGWVKKRGK